MLSNSMQDKFNTHLNAEIHSAYLYMSMVAYFESQNLEGMASWMRLQSQEELEHADKFFNFINQRGGRVVLTQIEAPQVEWDSPLAAFEEAYAHECLISSLINELADSATKENDLASNAFLQWFITEQVEEEATALGVVEKLRLSDGQSAALFMIDKELGARQPDAA